MPTLSPSSLLAVGQKVAKATGTTLLYLDANAKLQEVSDGTSGQVLSTDGAGGFSFSNQAITALNSAAENRLVTVGATTTELDAESGLTFDGSKLVTTGYVATGSNGYGFGSAAGTSKGMYSSGGDLRIASANTMTVWIQDSGGRVAAKFQNYNVTIPSGQLSVTAPDTTTSALVVTSVDSTAADYPTLQLNLGSGQASNALEINSSGGSGGDLGYINASGQLVLPNGAYNAPSLRFAGDSDSGLWWTSGSVVGLQHNAQTVAAVGITDGLRVHGSHYLSFSAGDAAVSASDVFLKRAAASSLQIGKSSATPSAQTLKGPDGSGTDISGATFQVGGGIGTGTGTDGGVTIVGAPAGTTGSSLNAQDVLATMGINGEITAPVQTGAATSDFVIAAADATVASGNDGASIYLTPGAGDGAGNDGYVNIVNSTNRQLRIYDSADSNVPFAELSADYNLAYLKIGTHDSPNFYGTLEYNYNASQTLKIKDAGYEVLGTSRTAETVWLSHRYNYKQIFIDTTGLVGINNTSPVAQLEITAPDAATVPLAIELDASQSANALEVNSSGGSGGDLAYFDSSGYLAIGRSLLSGSEFTAGNTAIGDTNIFQRGANMIGWSAGALDASPVVGLAKYDAGILAVTNGSSAKIASPASVTIVGESGSGTDISGATFQIGGGIGTGTGTDGGVTIVGAPATGSSSTLNTQQPLAVMGINGEVTAPTKTAAGAADFVIAASNAFATSGEDGGSIYLTPGAGDGAGASGQVFIKEYLYFNGSTSGTYIRGQGAGEIKLATSGAIRWSFGPNSLTCSTGGGSVANFTPSLGTANLRPAGNDGDTGIGGDGSNSMSLITGGAQTVVIGDGSDASATPLTVTSAASQQAGSPVFVVNETSGSGNIAEFQVGGTARVSIDPDGITTIDGSNSGSNVGFVINAVGNENAQFYAEASTDLKIPMLKLVDTGLSREGYVALNRASTVVTGASRNDLVIYTDASGGDIVLGPRAVAALTLDSSQDATFAGAIIGQAARYKSHDTKTNSDTPYTVLSTDHILYVDCTSGVVTINLPAVASSDGRELIIKKTDSTGNVVTIDGNSSETIDGATTQTISIQYESLTLHCDGTEWFIH